MSHPVPAPRVTIDTAVGAVYVTVRDDATIAETVEVADGCRVDLSSDGRVLGVEFLGVSGGVARSAVGILVDQLGVPGWVLWEAARCVGRVEALPLEPGATVEATFPLQQSYPPVTKTAVEPATGSPSPTHDTDPTVTAASPVGPLDGTHDPTGGTAHTAEGGR